MYINPDFLRASKQLLKASDVNLHVISEPPTLEAVAERLKMMPIPLEFKLAALEIAADGAPGFCLPFADHNGKLHALIYGNSALALSATDGAISPRFQKMLATFVTCHEMGHALDPQLWANVIDNRILVGPRELVSWYKAQDKLRGEQLADVYAMFHMIAILKPSLKDTQDFMREVITWRYQGTSLEHQTAPILDYLSKDLPAIHAKITQNTNVGSCRAQATHYTEKLMMDYKPSFQQVAQAAQRAHYNQEIAYRRHLRDHYRPFPSNIYHLST